MNLVNGWMFTGLGPYYMKDSSTAQNILATGITANLALSGAGTVIQDLTKLGGAGGTRQTTPLTTEKVTHIIERVEALGPRTPVRLNDYAQISIFEARLDADGKMEWVPVTEKSYFREFLGTSRDKMTTIPTTGGGGSPEADASAPGTRQSARLQSEVPEVDPELARAVLAGKPRFATLAPAGSRQAAVLAPGTGATPTPADQVVGPAPPCVKHPILNAIAEKCFKSHRPQIQQTGVDAASGVRLSLVPDGTQTRVPGPENNPAAPDIPAKIPATKE
jgi:hypothetical protein